MQQDQARLTGLQMLPTLRFEQSESSNNNHPLIFSTTTSKDQYLTSGVTYYLDGAVTYSQYTNTTTFNAATTRYVEINSFIIYRFLLFMLCPWNWYGRYYGYGC
jgi:hypothetical protein